MAFPLSPEALARRCARRPWRVIALWVLAVIACIALTGALLSDALTTQSTFTNKPEALRADELLKDTLRGPRSSNEVVIVRSEARTVDDPAFQAAVEALAGDLAALGPRIIQTETLASYYRTGADSLVSQDRHTTIVPFSMAGDLDDASDHIGQVVEVVQRAQGQEGFEVLIVGQATIGRDFQKLSQDDIERGETFGVPIALLILVLVFGALAAALVPLVLAGVSIVVALGVASLVGQVFALSFFVTNMITMIGLAVGIDYSLLTLARYREERARGLEKMEAIGRAGATATRTVLFSGLTVVLALTGMLLVPVNVFIGLGLGAIFVVVAAVLASMTLLPAILGLLGDRINRFAVPLVGRAQARFDEERQGGFWDRVARTVMARPIVSLALGSGLLIAAAVPVLGLNTGFAGVSTFPDRVESKRAFLILDKEFSAGEVTPAEIVIKGEIDSPQVQAAIDRLTAFMAADSSFAAPRPLEKSPARDVALLSAPVAGDAADKEAQDAIRRLRRQYIPAAFSGVPAQALVTGETAFSIDASVNINRHTPIAIAFILGVSLLLLTVVFRSIVVPIKAVLLNLLSVGATYGLMVSIFQRGVWNEALGFQESPIVEAWIPLFLFAVLFGLSMDYHVFLLSRIRERFDQTGDNTGSVAFGIRSTGRLITGAALIMVAVFWSFAAGELVGLQQMGFGLGTAILLDATIVRSVLVPASMKLLGRWNWYLPSALSWLPDLRVHPEEVRDAPVASTTG